MKSTLLLAILGAMLLLHNRASAADKLPAPESDMPAVKGAQTRKAVFAGGCFWCTEAVFRQLKGVKSVTSGYAGDTKDKADYEIVRLGSTKHAEAIRFEYDPSKITYGQLLQVFFTAHDPTTKDRQGNDVGRQYRSAIFYATPEEKKVAEAYIKQLDAAKVFPAPIVTTLEPLKEFFPAEEYHQDFVTKNPNQGYVRTCSLPKVALIREVFADWLKPEEKPK